MYRCLYLPYSMFSVKNPVNNCFDTLHLTRGFMAGEVWTQWF